MIHDTRTHAESVNEYQQLTIKQKHLVYCNTQNMITQH